MCTEACVDACPDGWKCVDVGTAGEATFICKPRWLGLCRPCQSVGDCPVSFDGECHSRDPAEGSFCATRCLDATDCPAEGFGCQGSLCVRTGAECPCDGGSEGLSTPCTRSNETGVCEGERRCEQALLTACSALVPGADVCDGVDNDCDGTVDDLAEPEACDGLDNDCDGEVDEELGTVACGQGECAVELAACADGAAAICSPFDGAAPESCDGLDNDCDGSTDEALGEASCGLGACVHAAPTCLAGVAQTCDPLEGATAEVCDGLDNDCDGLVDEELTSTTCGQGACAHVLPACVGGAPPACDPLAGAVGEACDGVDNDCDGQVDEDFVTVTCGQGVCAHALVQCASGSPQVCDPFLGAAPEACDGLDNDCDGEVDEGLGTLACGVGECAHETPACAGGAPQECDPLLGAAAELCDSLDNDCDGLVDEGLGTTACGQGQCAHVIATCSAGAPEVCDPFAGMRFQSLAEIDLEVVADVVAAYSVADFVALQGQLRASRRRGSMAAMDGGGE